jgi:hypothetical protein
MLASFERPLRSSGREFVRHQVRMRDGQQCTKCGKKQTKRALDVHHLDIELEGKEGRIYKNNLIHRMITLCHKCHLKLHYFNKRISQIEWMTETIKVLKESLCRYLESHRFRTDRKMIQSYFKALDILAPYR